jgi:hypothetical protein
MGWHEMKDWAPLSSVRSASGGGIYESNGRKVIVEFGALCVRA